MAANACHPRHPLMRLTLILITMHVPEPPPMRSAPAFHKFVVIIIIGRIKYVESVIFIFRCGWLRAYSIRVRFPSYSLRAAIFAITVPHNANRITSDLSIRPESSAFSLTITASVCRFVWIHEGMRFNKHATHKIESLNNNLIKFKYSQQTAIACCVLFDDIEAFKRMHACGRGLLFSRQAIKKDKNQKRNKKNKWIYVPNAFIHGGETSLAREFMSNSFIGI